jgi:PAS domain S-box-containing protein
VHIGNLQTLNFQPSTKTGMDASRTSNTNTRTKSRTYRVLIVEDDRAQAELVMDLLKLTGPFRCDWSENLCSLWNTLEKGEHDILLMDYRLPDGTGLEALGELRRHGYDLPVIMITGQGDERLAVKAMQLGAVDYLVKGTDYLLTLPSLIQKAVRAHELQLSVQRSLEQVRYQALLLNNVRDAVVVWNTEGKITYWNPAAEALFGVKAADRLGKPVETCYLNAFNPQVRVPSPEGTNGLDIERRFRTRDDRIVWISSRLSTLRDFGAAGRLIGYMDVSRDITSRKKAEEERKQAEASLRQSEAELIASNKALREKEAQIQAAQARLARSARQAAIGELASGVAHHINNPLTTVIAESQLLLLNLPGDHPARESAVAIEQAGWRVQRTVQQLVDFSQPTSDTLEKLSINDTITSALDLISDRIQSTGNRLEVDLEEGLPELQGNRQQLCDLWLNLLMLARDATADGQPHKISIRSKITADGLVSVEVHDDGRPIPHEDMATLFEPDFIKSIGGRGTGIELNICQEIVRHHHGEINAESSPESGTSFYVNLPVEVKSV